MNTINNKPKCLCLNSKTRRDNYEFHYLPMLGHADFYLRRFDVIMAEMECDLKQMIEEHSPDLIHYTGFPEIAHPVEPLQFPKNYDAYPEIPRIGILVGDKYSPGKEGSYYALCELGCKGLICSQTVSGELSYEIQDTPIFHMMNFSHTSILKDYGEEKVIPVGLFGAGFDFSNNVNNHYPWRKKVTKAIFDKVPLFHAPRPSGVNTIKNSHGITQDKYGRMLNSCKTAMCCGTEQNNLLQKHLEIPACRTCLITEETNILKDYGFIDMKNCVFADEKNICDKLEYLFTNPKVLQEITDNGYELSQQYVDPEKRYDLYYELYKLLKVQKSDERIIQDGVNSLRLVPKLYTDYEGIHYGPDLIRNYWEAGFKHLLKENPDGAIQEFNLARSYISYCPEAISGIGIISLVSKNIAQAEQCFSMNISHINRQIGLSPHYGDPIDIAYLLLIYYSKGRTQELQNILISTEGVEHPALSAIKSILANDITKLSDETNRLSRIPFNFKSQEWYNHFKSIIVSNKNGIVD